MAQKEKTSPADAATRRDFLKKTSTAAAVVAAANVLKTPVYGQNQAPSPGRVIGANDRIAVAVVGVGFGIGKNHLQGIHKNEKDNNVVVAAACDLFSKRRDWAKMEAGLTDADLFSDHRKLLERKDIDAVVVATHDPWHAPVSIDAMQTGKHVYCEKPMTRYLGEAFQIYDSVKRTGRIFQVGSQGCSAAGWHKSGELIRNGKIGTLIWSQGYYCRNQPKGEWNYDIEKESTPENIDWERWLGPVKKRIPFSADHFHRWRKYYPYCGGLLGDLVPHRLHPLLLASGTPEFPKRVTSIGTKNVHSDKKTPGTPERDVPEHVQLSAEFPSGYLINITSSTVNARSPGFAIYGHKATLEIGDQGNVIKMIPERTFAEDFDALSDTERKSLGIDPFPISGLQHEDIRVHEKNWFDSIRANKQPNAGIDLAIRVQTVICLAEMAERLGMTCHFDEKTRKVTDGKGKEVQALNYGWSDLS
ncbi:MAG: Gfo/Idh/MocA family oxidoreductase [Verrucomicrobia bacterium]|nr:Gfo/Idh/MocA family oxidoreductase [Verrucomicrobiota bacterium]